jgi:ATP-dependent Zn protease
MEAPFDEATAYHEAGHAVVALSVGRPVHRVSVLPNRERLGVCEFRKGVFRPTKDWLEEEILISLGGVAAEARRTGTYAWAEAGRDLAYVRRLAIQRAGERQAPRLEKRLLAKAENLLADEELWRAVELIAAELVRHGSISGRAVRHFFEQCRDKR